MSDSSIATLASSAKIEEASSQDAPGFVYPPLDRSENQFRLLQLKPGDPDDEIEATIVTCPLPALPRGFDHELHLSELMTIYEQLSAATGTCAEMQTEELFRWERLYTELNELYLLAAPTVPLESGQNSISLDGNMERLRKMREDFLDQAKQYQIRPHDVPEFDAVQALINRLEMIFPSEKNPGPWALRSRQEYTAVSYCCGDQTILEAITLNNVRIQVPASAARALRGIRAPKWSLVVWIDAICIHPDDPRERAHQVLLMSKIYASSRETIVWLESEGKAAEELLVANASKLKPHLQPYNFGTGFRPRTLFDDDSKIPKTTRDAVEELLTSLSIYFKQPWFGRLWVYQEVLLSQEVSFQAGRSKVDWLLIRMALEFYDHLSPAAESRNGVNVNVLGAAAPWCRRKFAYSTSEGNPFKYTPPSLTELLLGTVPFECLDPRDKVYALLGLTSWSTRRKKLPAELQPDYQLPVEECMRNATLAAICEGKSLECLTLPVWTKRTSRPTWVVPWHELDVSRNRPPHAAVETLESHFDKCSQMPDCSRGQKVDMNIWRQLKKPDSLFLEGHRFGKISKVSSFIDPQAVEDLSFEMTLRNVIQSVRDLLEGRDSPGGLSFFLVIALWWRALIISPKGKRWGEILQEEYVEDLGATSEEIEPSLVDGDHDNSPEVTSLRRLMEHLYADLNASHGFENRQGGSSSNWQMAATLDWQVAITAGLNWSISNTRFYLATTKRPSDAGPTEYMLGCGPIDMEPRDEVVVLHGSRAPIVLRPEQTSWQWVGPAFCHTLRDRTLILNCPSPESSIEVFEIR